MFPRPPDGWVGGRDVEGTSIDHCWLVEDDVIVVLWSAA